MILKVNQCDQSICFCLSGGLSIDQYSGHIINITDFSLLINHQVIFLINGVDQLKLIEPLMSALIDQLFDLK